MKKIDDLINLVNNNSVDNKIELFENETEKKLFQFINIVKEGFDAHNESYSDCFHDQEEICSYIEGNLSGEEKKIVEKNLSQCSGCFNFFVNLAIAVEDKSEIKVPENYLESILYKEEVTQTTNNSNEITSFLNQLTNDENASVVNNLKTKQIPPKKEELKQESFFNLFSSYWLKIKKNLFFTGSGALVGSFATFMIFFSGILINKSQNINDSMDSISPGTIANSDSSNFLLNEDFKKIQTDIKNNKIDENTFNDLMNILDKYPDFIDAEWELSKLYECQADKIKAKEHYQRYVEKAEKINSELKIRINEAKEYIKNLKN